MGRVVRPNMCRAGFSAGPVSDVTVGGHAGKAVVLTNSINTDTAGCTSGPMLPMWTWRGKTSGAQTNGGSTEQVWVIDVGGRIVVIDGESFAGSAPVSIHEITLIVASIGFE